MPGPVPAYSNPAIEPQYYQPSRFEISGITLGATTTITTTAATNYVIGQLVRISIPFPYRCFQLNGQQGYVLSLPTSTSVEVAINSTDYDSFDANPSSSTTPPQITAIGDVNSGQVNSSGRANNVTYINGSFINISPN